MSDRERIERVWLKACAEIAGEMLVADGRLPSDDLDRFVAEETERAIGAARGRGVRMSADRLALLSPMSDDMIRAIAREKMLADLRAKYSAARPS